MAAKPKETKTILSDVEVETETKKETRILQYDFTQDEIRELGKKLASNESKIGELQADKKRTMDDFKSKLSQAEADRGLLKNKINSGHETRDIECEVIVNMPAGKKTVRRLDRENDPRYKPSDEIVGIEELTQAERQKTMKFIDDELRNGDALPINAPSNSPFAAEDNQGEEDPELG